MERCPPLCSKAIADRFRQLVYGSREGYFSRAEGSEMNLPFSYSELKCRLPELKRRLPELKRRLPELKRRLPELKRRLPELKSRTETPPPPPARGELNKIR